MIIRRNHDRWKSRMKYSYEKNENHENRCKNRCNFFKYWFFHVWMKITPVFTPVIILILKIENMDHVRLPTNGVLKYFDFSSLWSLMIVKFAI